MESRDHLLFAGGCRGRSCPSLPWVTKLTSSECLRAGDRLYFLFFTCCLTCSQAVWALGNIIGDGPHLRDYVIQVKSIFFDLIYPHNLLTSPSDHWLISARSGPAPVDFHQPRDSHIVSQVEDRQCLFRNQINNCIYSHHNLLGMWRGWWSTFVATRTPLPQFKPSRCCNIWRTVCLWNLLTLTKISDFQILLCFRKSCLHFPCSFITLTSTSLLTL